MKRISLLMVAIWMVIQGNASSLLIPMDAGQTNHLKAYGVAFYSLTAGMDVEWLLNYRGGSFMMDYSERIHKELNFRGVSYEMISDSRASQLKDQINSPSVNQNVVKLEKAPRIAVYSPKSEWIEDESDAVIAVLEYAEIPFTIIYDEEILTGELSNYDWLHLHHEDFTGQIYRHLFREESYREAEMQRATAASLGYPNVPAMKYDVALNIRRFCATGNYLFAMCSGAETFDIALATNGYPISTDQDGEVDLRAQSKLDYSKSFAFENFRLQSGWRFSDINENTIRFRNPEEDYFTLFEFSAKWDIVPSLLTQNHEHVIEEFFGLTTAFNRDLVKSSALILGENARKNRVRYIYGPFGKGHWTYYSGHDPERPPVRGRPRRPMVEMHPNSPGYRLILNNVLFPAAKKKKQKT